MAEWAQLEAQQCRLAESHPTHPPAAPPRGRQVLGYSRSLCLIQPGTEAAEDDPVPKSEDAELEDTVGLKKVWCAPKVSPESFLPTSNFSFWDTTSRAQDLLLALHAGIAPNVAWGYGISRSKPGQQRGWQTLYPLCYIPPVPCPKSKEVTRIIFKYLSLELVEQLRQLTRTTLHPRPPVVTPEQSQD